jgi:hypothetical protein
MHFSFPGDTMNFCNSHDLFQLPLEARRRKIILPCKRGFRPKVRLFFPIRFAVDLGFVQATR